MVVNRDVAGRQFALQPAEVRGLHNGGFQPKFLGQLLRPVPTKNSEGVEKSGDLFRSAVVSPTCTHSFRNSSHGSGVGFAAA